MSEGSQAMKHGHEDLEGFTHYRLLPGVFPKGMGFHFDGLAVVMKVEFSGGKVKHTFKPYNSNAYQQWDKCLFLGTGTNHLGTKNCLTNPGVNLLPIQGQLWLTIDTSLWGRVDPETLETLPNTAKVPSSVLNAHPACEKNGGNCFVQYNCGKSIAPYTNQACISLLNPSSGDMEAIEVSRATLPKNMIIQHSHSPCLTENYVVSKLDAFVPRNPFNKNSGMLHLLRQGEDNLWMVMDRRTNTSRVMKSNASFVNNHFWNCFESSTGEVVVDSVAATENYLDNYFTRHLEEARADWESIFHPPLRCKIPTSGEDIQCESFFTGAERPLFDYPTFNPLFKMNP